MLGNMFELIILIACQSSDYGDASCYLSNRAACLTWGNV